jgi:hypothetical protein
MTVKVRKKLRLERVPAPTHGRTHNSEVFSRAQVPMAEGILPKANFLPHDSVGGNIHAVFGEDLLAIAW